MNRKLKRIADQLEKKAVPSAKTTERRGKKLSGYGTQLLEKQKVKSIYGVYEKQFKRFYSLAVKAEGSPGDNLLSLLERRLDNAVYRLKFSVTRAQSRQVVVHGHVFVNGKRVYSPSYLVSVGDVITMAPNVASKQKFLEQVIDKRLSMGIKVPDWLELESKSHKGTVLRMPIRSDVQAPIEEHLIVELYSK